MSDYIKREDAIFVALQQPLYSVVSQIKQLEGIDIVKCVDCRKCKEQGGHANCNGYLYCTRQKTMVDEDCFCAWGERKE